MQSDLDGMRDSDIGNRIFGSGGPPPDRCRRAWYRESSFRDTGPLVRVFPELVVSTSGPPPVHGSPETERHSTL